MATSPVAHEAAEAALAAKGGALSAVLAGFFADAGADAGVLFSPVQLLVGGLGAGAFAYDGRPRQPGREVKRPRGFQSGEEVSPAARAAVPGSLVALSIACAYQTGVSLLSASKSGVVKAKAAGCKRRAEFIDRMAGLGASGLCEPQLKRALLSRFGPPEGGQWGHQDLVPVHSVQQGAIERAGRLVVPWGDAAALEGVSVDGAAAGPSHALLAIDASGLLCAMSYRSLSEDLVLEEFEVAVPALARPVLRGVPRVAPGTPLSGPARLALTRDSRGRLDGVEAQVSDQGEPLRLVRDAETKLVSVPTFVV